MKLIRRRPDYGYFDNWLWLPKQHVSERQIQMSLIYEGRDREIIRGWEEEPYHFRVPRNYYEVLTLTNLPYPVRDTRFLDFPRIDLRSSAIMDAKEPSATYQRDSCKALLGTYDGILCLRCGAGKTVVALHAAAQVKQPILIIVNEKTLANQWVKEIRRFLGLKEEDIGRIGGDGSPFVWEKPITIALVQSLAQRAIDRRIPPEMVRHFGVIIPDEAHVMAAPYFNKALPPFHGRRWGLSATPERDDGFDSLLRATVGEITYTYLTPDLKPTAIFRRLDTRLDTTQPDVFRETHDISREFHFGKTYNYLAESKPERTETIANDIKAGIAMGRQCLVLTHSRAMCEKLAEHFTNPGVVYAGVKGKERMRRIHECNPVIAIMQIGKQALDKPSLDTVYICEPTKKPNVLQQIMGRALRNFRGKRDPLFIIYEDMYIKPLFKMCQKIRATFNRWPAHKGGQIPFKIVQK